MTTNLLNKVCPGCDKSFQCSTAKVYCSQECNFLFVRKQVSEAGGITCSTCKTFKTCDEYHKASSRASGYSAKCKKCTLGYYKTWQEKNPESSARRKDWKAERVRENRLRLVEFYSENPCVDCGNPDYRVLECDHVEGDKVAGVATMITRGSSWDSILEEIAKCVVRCKNCHGIVTGERAGFWWCDI